MDGHQMYFGGSAVDKASTIGIEISPTPPLTVTGVKKCEIWRRLKHPSTLSRPRWKCSKISEIWNKSAMLRWSPYVLAKFCEVGSTHRWQPEKALSVQPDPLKFKHSGGICCFITSQPIHYKCSRSKVKVTGSEVKT